MLCKKLQNVYIFPGGYVWAYNAQIYFSQYFPGEDVGRWLSWIPLVGGSFGVLFGGFISDRVVKKRGLPARVWVLVISQVINILVVFYIQFSHSILMYGKLQWQCPFRLWQLPSWWGCCGCHPHTLFSCSFLPI